MSLLAGGGLFGITGILAIANPMPFASPGAYGDHGRNLTTTVYSTHETAGIGVIFLLIAGSLLYGAYRIAKGR